MDRRKRILVADDDRATRELLTQMLMNVGYEVAIAEDGLDAVEKATSEKPDLVLLDGLMPKLHGFLACKAIKQLDAPPKVLMLTGIYTKLTYKWEAKDEYLADGFLSKPFDQASLLASIGTLLPDFKNDKKFAPLEAPAQSVFIEDILSQNSEKGFTIAQGRLADGLAQGADVKTACGG